MSNSLKLIISIIISELAGVIGSIFTDPNSAWYTSLAKPSFMPPAWLFAPVWIILYALMGIAAYLIWKEGWDKRNVRIGLSLFILQLALNALWSIIFFGLHLPEGAFRTIVALWIVIVLDIIIFSRASKPAAWLLVPYILWVSFAAVLNFFIWQLNF